MEIFSNDHIGLPFEYKTVDFSNFVTYLFGTAHCNESPLFRHLYSIGFDISKYQLGIAGGAIRDIFSGNKLSDIDIFSLVKGSNFWIKNASETTSTLMGMSLEQVVSLNNQSSYAKTQYYKSTIYNDMLKVQFVKPDDKTRIVSGTPIEIISNFDFTINQFIFHGNNKLTYNVLGMSDLMTRTLRLVSFDNINSMNGINVNHKIDRLNKFLRLGYKLDLHTAKKLLSEDIIE